MRRPTHHTSAHVQEVAAQLVNELAAPGSFTARTFAQMNAAETLCIRCRDYFTRVHPTAPELAAIAIVAPLYAKRYPLT
jgi:hypothetical protein